MAKSNPAAASGTRHSSPSTLHPSPFTLHPSPSTLHPSPSTHHPPPLRLRRRADLEVRQQSYEGAVYWLVKDPIALKYYRLESEEFAILEMLDGHTSLGELQGRFARRFAPQQIELYELHRLLGLFYRCSLIVSEVAGQGAVLAQRGRERRREERRTRLTNLLSIRVRGMDPNRLLVIINRWFGWFFTPWAIVFNLALVSCALVMVIVQFDEIYLRLPGFHEFFSIQNWLLLAVVLAFTKVLHELGHGTACKRLGGECHELGLMLLVLTPCLYCNVSDSWMLANKWHRAAIGAAGMYVELVLAALAACLWRVTDLGLINDLCLGVMFTCSVSTLLFNANPLMRYDGYYILSDLIEVPNLRQKAFGLLRQLAASWLLGFPPQTDSLPKRGRVWFVTYATASLAYSWSVWFAILCFLYQVMEPYGAKVVGQLMVCAVIGGTIVMSVRQWTAFFKVPGRFDRLNKLRLSMVGATAIVFVSLFLLWPLPQRIRCPLQVVPREAANIYVDVAGRVSEIFVQPGQLVSAAQPLLRLQNTDLELSTLELTGQRDQLAIKLDHLHQRSFTENDALAVVAATEEALASLHERLTERQRDIERLTIRAAASGEVIPATRTPKFEPDARQLSSWYDTPLDRHNLGAYLNEATLVCRIGDVNKMEAILAIDQDHVDSVQVGQAVDLFLEQLPGRPFRGTIQQVAKVDMQVAPSNLTLKAGGEVATRTDRQGREHVVGTMYQASVAFDDPEGHVFLDSRGQAKIHAGYRTMADRLWTFVARTFEFEM